MTTLRPNLTRRLRRLLLALVILFVLAASVHSAAVTLLVGLLLLVSAEWVLRTR